jgi:mRNA interferase RelE/StbE
VSFRVSLSRAARSRLARLDRDLKQRIGSRIHQLALDPFDPRFSKPLADRKGHRSSRIGGWRMLYTVSLDLRTVQVLSIEPRGQAYRDL